MNSWYSIDNPDDVPSPTLLVYPDRIEENLRRMIHLAGDVSRLRPHVKTHKMPQIIAMKRELGIDKFKTSTIAESEMTASAGGKDILMAYQPVGPNIRRFIELIRRFPETHFSALVDNLESLSDIAKCAQSHGVVACLYVDLNVGMNRTGIIPGPDAAQLYQALCSTDGVSAGGVHAYDGHLHQSDLAEITEQNTLVFEPVWSWIEGLRKEGFEVPNIIAGGTPTSGLLAKRGDVEVGLGTAVLWDFGQSITSPYLDFQNAAVLLARVISHPTANRICIDLGHKAVASEMTHPRVRWFGLEDAIAVIHSEEHLVLETDKSNLFPVGTVVYGLPKHICPTVALHNEVWTVTNRIAGEKWPVIARARSLTI
ncbi:MAG: D-TA family PLP-dependent enzyme [Planctomycetota bacterium]|nr:D-TA family PLP-dependent enzyme [Planctomycetota bacterium]